MGGEDDEGERLKLCFVDAEGETVEALPHPRGKPLPLLAPKNGAAEMRKIVRPVLDAVLHHVNKGVEPAMQMSMMDVTTMVLGSRQVRVRVRVRARARARVRVRVRVRVGGRGRGRGRGRVTVGVRVRVRVRVRARVTPAAISLREMPCRCRCPAAWRTRHAPD